MADLLPFTSVEARVILRADEALDATYEARVSSGTTFDDEEREAWLRIIESARIACKGAVYTGDQLLDTDLDTISELLRVALEDRHQRLYEIREKMILRMGDLVDEPDTPRSKAYTIKRLTEADLAEIAELLRMTLKDDHYLSAHPRIREIRDRMIVVRKVR